MIESGLACQAARWLVRLEIPLLACIYLYFVISDNLLPTELALILIIWLARWWTTGRVTISTSLDLPILLILLCLAVSLWVSTNLWLSLPKAYGVILSIAFYYAVVNAVTTRRDLAWTAFWIVAVCFAMALAGLVGTDWAQGKIVSLGFIYDRVPRFVQGLPRSIAGGFARNGVGGTLALTVPLLASLVLARPISTWDLPAKVRAWFWRLAVLALATSLLVLGLTQSRGALLGVGVGLLALGILHERRLAWVIAAGAGALAIVFLTGHGTALLELLLRMDAQNATLASRLEVWQRGIWMVQDFPFTGIGIGTYNVVAHALYPFFIASSDEVVAHAHNNLLQVAVDLGIPGLVAYSSLVIGFVIGVFRTYRQNHDAGIRALAAGLGFGMLAHQTFGLTDAFMLGTKPGVLMWVYLALGIVLIRQSQGEIKTA